MHIHIISLFPEIFTSFLETSLIKKAQEKKILTFSTINPRIFCKDKHQQIDDQIYGGGAWMLIKAKPIIDAIEHVIEKYKLKNTDFKILFPAPTEEEFTQKHAYSFSKQQHLIFICGRYEGIDYRFEKYIIDKYPSAFQKLSLGKFILLWGEVASMTMIEAITRLIPEVIKESESRIDESYNLKNWLKNIEPPQYTRPESVYGYKVPPVLLTGNQKEIQKRKQQKEK